MSTRPSASLRIGDAERDATVDLLNRHYADGRLTATEREERTAIALTARTARDLDELLADLPRLDESRKTSTRRARRWPGRAPHPVAVALLAAVVLVVALHAIPFIAAFALFFFVTRLFFGGRGPWCAGGHARRW